MRCWGVWSSAGEGVAVRLAVLGAPWRAAWGQGLVLAWGRLGVRLGAGGSFWPGWMGDLGTAGGLRMAGRSASGVGVAETSAGLEMRVRAHRLSRTCICCQTLRRCRRSVRSAPGRCICCRDPSARRSVGQKCTSIDRRARLSSRRFPGRHSPASRRASGPRSVVPVGRGLAPHLGWRQLVRRRGHAPRAAAARQGEKRWFRCPDHRQ
ncbi:MAG: hypothetical protein QOG59_1834 [Solirubrobacteraceae bacterium]|nr:hypothetical protein [Solirubrobacteraceae bacterium]